MAQGQSGKSKKGQQSTKHASKYERQKRRTAENKIKARKKHLAENPKDEQNKKILEKLLK